MIDVNPFLRLLAERRLSLEQLANLSGLSSSDVHLFAKGKSVTKKKLNAICSVLNCQPCDILEYRKTAETGHWVYISSE